jgi:lipoprotein YgeR
MAAPIGTPVLAAAAGSVIYAGDQVRGYGNMVVIKHAAIS